MTGKGFINSTAALLTGIGTLLAALVAVAILLVGEGVLFNSDDGSPGGNPPGGGASGAAPKLGEAVQFEDEFGRDDTTGFELDGEGGIIRNPGNDGDVVFYEASGLLGSFRGRIIEWQEAKQPSQQECADLLNTHGKTGTYPIEIGGRFCVRSSGGRTAFLAVISNGQEYQVSVWKKS